MDDMLLKQHMSNGTPMGRHLYLRLVRILDAIGPYTVHPARSTITFKGTRRGFCGAHPKGDCLVGYIDLMRRVENDPRIRSVSPYTKTLFVHHFRISSEDQMDDTFQGWIAQAYGVGRGDHLNRRSGIGPPTQGDA